MAIIRNQIEYGGGGATKLSELTDDSTHRLVTDEEKAIWNKSDKVAKTYSSEVAYNKGDIVYYSNKIYERLLDGAAGIAVTDTTYWKQYADMGEVVSELNSNLSHMVGYCDFSNLIASKSITSAQTITYTATQNCWARIELRANSSGQSNAYINEKRIMCCNGISNQVDLVPLFKGDILKINTSVSPECSYEIYGLRY